jgi:hypothetical protein
VSTVIANMSMSLDGFIADPGDGVEHLFGWYGNGPVETPTADPAGPSGPPRRAPSGCATRWSRPERWSAAGAFST